MPDDSYAAGEPNVTAGRYVLLASSDTGCGMAPDVLTRAFEPFSTTKFVPFFITNREGQGTGLGLSMAYGVLKQSNGHIRIYSEVGSGAAIEISLSRSMQPEVEFSSSRSALITGGTKTILVVEDDAVVQETVVDTLHGLGKQVLRPSDGQAALAILQSGIPVNMIFSNVVMPGPVRSIDMARQAKQLSPNIAVLFTSGYTQNAIVHGGRLNPGVQLISKPYRREALARKIRQVIAGNKPNKPTSAPLQILVVVDDEDTCMLQSELLGILEHWVDSAESGEAALASLQDRYFDVLLTDMTLPGISGRDLAGQALRSRHEFKKIGFSSGYGASMTKNLEFDATTLPKPFTLSSLQQLLDQVA